MTTATVPQVEQIDPAAILVDRNIRTADVDPDLDASIKAHGVLVPILAVRTSDGQIRARDGHRRLTAAIRHGLTAVPVLITGDEDDDAADRIIRQYVINEHRASLTTSERTAVVQQLLDLGLTAGQVTRRARIPKRHVEAAQAVAASHAATAAAAANPALTLDMAAGIAEFDGEADAVQALTDSAAEGPGRFEHALARLREQRAEQQDYQALRAEIEASGVTVVDYQPDWSNRVMYLADGDGKRLDEEAHKACPGHVVYIVARGWTDDDGNRVFDIQTYCTDPQANGHLDRASSSGTAKSPEDQTEERRRVRAGNTAWNASTSVRQDWLRNELLARSKPPAGALAFLAAAIARRDDPIRYAMERGHGMARDLLGIGKAEPQPGLYSAHEIAGAMDGAGEPRTTVMLLAVVLGAFEQRAADPQFNWRTPKGGYAKDTARYLSQLEAWGYFPSDIERAVIDGKTWKQPEK
jgi:ParB family chromosome partitioning protein